MLFNIFFGNCNALNFISELFDENEFNESLQNKSINFFKKKILLTPNFK